MDFWKLRSKKIAELLNYLVAWGRLCVLNPNDSNKRRWELVEFWEIVTSAADVWDDGIYWPTSRRSKEFKGVSEEYIRGVAGTVSGAMARLNPEKPTLFSMLDEMDEYGSGLEEIQKDAEKKADVFSRT
jgi:hypothetical protein